MSLWWIGVKGSKFQVFEATEIEAFSLDFEDIYGMAFGMYRTKAQAETGVKEHAKYMIKEAASMRLKRKKDAEITPKFAQEEKKSLKAIQKGAENVEKSQKEANTVVIPPGVYEVRGLLKALQDLKLHIVRTIEAGKLLKSFLEENYDTDKD